MPLANTLTLLAAEGGPKPLGALLDFAPGAMIWTFLAFGVGLIFMWKFVYGPITAALEERDTKVEDAMGRAERQAAEAVREADERAKAELQKARDTIAAEKRQAVQEIRAIAVDLTIAATGKLLGQEVDAAKNKPLVEQFVSGAEQA